jgi:hypothetical protein
LSPSLVTTGDQARYNFLPFHPGAVRYYREIGISIPDWLVVTNWLVGSTITSATFLADRRA